MTAAPIVALGGFMGTGKTTLGRRLAEELERPFVDLDDQVEKELGASTSSEDSGSSSRALAVCC